MGVFIKVDGDKVTLAGTVANKKMLEDGYFEYKGNIPASPYLKFVDGVVVIDEQIPDPQLYADNRVKEYPAIGDQLDAIWKFLTPPEGTEAYAIKQKIQAVKTKYPKAIL